MSQGEQLGKIGPNVGGDRRASRLQQAKIDTARGEGLSTLPDQVDAELQAVAVQLSQDLQVTFRQVGEKVLAHVFDDEELDGLLDRLNAEVERLRRPAPIREPAMTSS